MFDFYIFPLKSLPDDKLKTIQQTLDVMEQKYSESEMKITRLLSEKKELEEQLEMKDKFVCMAVRHLQELEKERNYLKMWFVSYFHPFHFTSLSPCT
jgi:RNA processing factor Prp31